MAKNIILCSDGTGNAGGKAEGTNVWRLFLAVDQARPLDSNVREQISFYDDGVGTQSFKILRLIGGAFGWGISRNLERLYGYLIQNYQPGDFIYLFGFSRGAFTVRVLADIIALCGIANNVVDDHELSPSEIAHLAHQALQTYKNQKRDWFASKTAAEEFRKVHAHKGPDGQPLDTPIECVGVWDTVDAVGLPFDELTAAFRWFFPLRLRDQYMSSTVRHGLHALSVDEPRLTFRPVLWEPDPRVEQVWFPGVHANVGGGYPKDQLALVSLNWMMARAEALGLRFHPNVKADYQSGASVQGQLYDPRAGLGAYYRYGPRRIDHLGEPTNLSKGLHDKRHLEKPHVHVSLLQRIAGGIDGYAPTGIPKTYIVEDGVLPRPEPHPDKRLHHMELAYDLIWMRRIGYYLFLIWTLWVLYCGWVLSFEQCAPARNVVTTALEVVRTFAPWKLDDVVVGYEKYQWFLAVNVVVYLVLWWWSNAMRDRTRDVAVAAWRLGFGHNVPNVQRRGLVSHLVRPIRKNHTLQKAFRGYKRHVVPPLTLILVVCALGGRVGWFAWKLPAPVQSTDARTIELGQTESTRFNTTLPYHSTGWKLVRGERYCVTVAVTSDWADDDLKADPKGYLCETPWQWKPALWLGVPYRRVVQAPWFQLRGEIGTSGHVQLALGDRADFEAAESGELFLYVNDVPGFYDNNHGSATVTITRPACCR